MCQSHSCRGAITQVLGFSQLSRRQGQARVLIRSRNCIVWRSQVHSNPHIKHAVDIEQFLMEGAYNKVSEETAALSTSLPRAAAQLRRGSICHSTNAQARAGSVRRRLSSSLLCMCRGLTLDAV